MGLLDALTRLFGGGSDGVDASRERPVADGDGGGSDAETGAAADAESTWAAEARSLADYWSEYDLDFTPDSLARLDDLMDERVVKERFRDAELGGEREVDRVYTGLVRQLGSYYGEVLVRHLDGAWIDHEDLGTVVEVHGDGGATAVADVFHVAADCLTEPSTFAPRFDTVADQLDSVGERAGEGGRADTAESHGWTGDGEGGGASEDEDRGRPSHDAEGGDERTGDEGGQGVDGDDGGGTAEGDRGGRGADGDEALSRDEALERDDVRAGFRDVAAALVEQWPGYDLDYTPGSLRRLDALVDGLPPAETDAEAAGVAAYLGETFVGSYGADWTDSEEAGWVVAVTDPDGEERVLVVPKVVETCLSGDATFAEVHDTFVQRFGLDGPALAGEDRAVGEDPDVGEDDGAVAEGGDGDGVVEEGDGDGVVEEGDDDGVLEEDDGGDSREESDPVIDRLAAEAAEETPAREPAADVGEERRAAAEELADGWRDYELDFSVESLARLDALVADHYDVSDGDRDYEGDPLSVPQGTHLSIPTDGSVEAFAGYLAEVFGRNHAAEWRRTEAGDLVLVVEGETAAAELEPEMVAIACFAGESSFVDAYARVAADVGLEPPIGG